MNHMPCLEAVVRNLDFSRARESIEVIVENAFRLYLGRVPWHLRLVAPQSV